MKIKRGFGSPKYDPKKKFKIRSMGGKVSPGNFKFCVERAIKCGKKGGASKRKR